MTEGGVYILQTMFITPQMCLYYKIITQSPLDASFGNSFCQNNAVRYCPYNGLLAWSVNNVNCSRDFAVKPVSLAENKYIWDDTKKRKKIKVSEGELGNV